MTIVEILDGLAELGRLRLERERQEAGVRPQDAGMSTDMIGVPTTDTALSHQAEQSE